MKQGEPQSGEHRSGSQVAFDPLEDRRQGDELARRVEIEHVVDQPLGARDDGKARADRLAGGVCPDFRGRTAKVVGIERRLAQLAAAELVPADRATVVPGDGVRVGPDRRPQSSPGIRPTT